MNGFFFFILFLGNQAIALEWKELEGRPAEIHVGDPLSYRLEGTQELPPGLIYEPQDLSSSGFRIHSSGDKIEIYPIKSGDLTLPELTWKSEGGASYGKTPPLSFHVEASSDGKGEPPPPFLPPLKLKVPLGFILLVLLLSLLIFGGILYFIIRRIKNRKSTLDFKPLPKAPPKPEDIEALEALSRLEGEGLPARGEVRLHAYRISEILKRYLGRRYSFDAQESTTEEISRHLDRLALGEDLRSGLLQLLRRLDQIKFSKEIQAPQTGRDDLYETRKFVEVTRRRQEGVVHAVS